MHFSHVKTFSKSCKSKFENFWLNVSFCQKRIYDDDFLKQSLRRLGFLRTKSNLVIWSVKSWTLNFWSVIWKKLISGWFSWSLILLIFDLWWTLIRWSVKQLDLWSFDLPWSMLLIFWSRWSLKCDLSSQTRLMLSSNISAGRRTKEDWCNIQQSWLNCLRTSKNAYF